MNYGANKLNIIPEQRSARFRSGLMPLEDLVEKFSEVAEKPIGDFTNSQRDSMNDEPNNSRPSMQTFLKNLGNQQPKKTPNVSNLQKSYIANFEGNHPYEELVDFEPSEFESSYDSTQPMYTVTFKAANGWNILTLPEKKVNSLLENLNKKTWNGVRVGITFHNDDYFSGMDWGYVAEFNDSKQNFCVRNEMTDNSVVAKKMEPEKIKTKCGYEGKVFENAYAFRGIGGEKSTIQKYMFSGKIKSIHSVRRPRQVLN
ncbi:MAG: hypothetical protein AABX93_00790 [Nanoarchaeota archaeon]